MEEKNVLDLKFETSDFDEPITIREYFKQLLKSLWVEGDGFSGKRPFGNSGWQFDVYKALIQNGFIDGKLDPDGYVESVDTRIADRFVLNQIIEKLAGDD